MKKALLLLTIVFSCGCANKAITTQNLTAAQRYKLVVGQSKDSVKSKLGLPDYVGLSLDQSLFWRYYEKKIEIYFDIQNKIITWKERNYLP